MRLAADKFYATSIWGMLPVFLAFLMFVATFIIKFTGKEVISPIEEFNDKKKFHRAEKLFFGVDYLSEIYSLICVMLATVPAVAFLNVKFESYVYAMVKKIDVVTNVIMGLTTIAITMAVVIILFDKRYYIVFSIREVLQKYKFAEALIIVIFCCILVSVITLTLLNEKMDSYFDFVRFMILEISAIYNVIGVTYISGVIINIMFLEQKNELTLLEQLYRRFWFRRIDTLYFKSEKKWNKNAIEINVEYLLERYMSVCKSKKIVRLETMEFVTTIGCYKKKWYPKARKKFKRMMLFFLFISIVIDAVILKGNCEFIIFINILVTIISVILSYTNMQSFQLVIMRLYLDTWGYYLKTNTGKELFIPQITRRKNNTYNKYILRMNSLIAFFYIGINYVGKRKETMEYEFRKMLLCLEDLNSKNIMIYLPVFSIGFFFFEKKIKIEKLKEIYSKTVVAENKRYLFERMLYSQVAYLTKNFNEELFSSRSRLNEYLKWITG